MGREVIRNTCTVCVCVGRDVMRTQRLLTQPEGSQEVFLVEMMLILRHRISKLYPKKDWF